MKEVLEHFGAAVTALTIGLLLMSISHEYGYFYVVGRYFQTFLSTTDYFNNAVLWVPAMLVTLYWYVDWDAIAGRSNLLALGWNKYTLAWIFFFVALPVIVFFFAPFDFILVFPALTTLWLMYANRLLPFADTDVPNLRALRKILLAAPILAGALFIWGIIHASGDLRSLSNLYSLQTKDGGTLQRIALRSFDKGLLVRNVVDNRIEFVRWDEIQKIFRIAPPQEEPPLFCSWFGINCKLPPIP